MNTTLGPIGMSHGSIGGLVFVVFDLFFTYFRRCNLTILQNLADLLIACANLLPKPKILLAQYLLIRLFTLFLIRLCGVLIGSLVIRRRANGTILCTRHVRFVKLPQVIFFCSFLQPLRFPIGLLLLAALAQFSSQSWRQQRIEVN